MFIVCGGGGGGGGGQRDKGCRLEWTRQRGSTRALTAISSAIFLEGGKCITSRASDLHLPGPRETRNPSCRFSLQLNFAPSGPSPHLSSPPSARAQSRLPQGPALQFSQTSDHPQVRACARRPNLSPPPPGRSRSPPRRPHTRACAEHRHQDSLPGSGLHRPFTWPRCRAPRAPPAGPAGTFAAAPSAAAPRR